MLRKGKGIKETFQYFFLGFFSDKLLKTAVNRNYLNILLSFILALAFIYSGVILGFSIPFQSLYNRSSDFRSFVNEAFSESSGTELKIANNYAVSNVVINTFANEEDKSKFAKYGYTLVIDTRPSGTTYDDFEAYCISNDGKNTEITYEDYLTLSDIAKLNFEFKIRYTGKELVFTEEKIAGYTRFLESVSDEAIIKEYNELKSQTLQQEQFNRKLYALYIKAYYPDLSSYETDSDIPLLHSYYYHNFLNTENNTGKYLFIFDYSCMASFKTDSGIAVSFGGFYTKLGTMTLNGTNNKTDMFILGSFRAANDLNFYIVVSGLMNMFPFMLLVWFLCLLLFYFICKFDGLETYKSFGMCAKVISNFVLWSGLFAALSSFISGFLVARENLFNVSLAVFFFVLVVRSVVLLICEHIRKRRIEKCGEDEEKIIGGE